jgi:hypothetical protein
MAYSEFGLSLSQGVTNCLERNDAFIVWTYSTEDSFSDVKFPGYFNKEGENSVSAYLKVDDVILVKYGSGINAGNASLKVKSIDPVIVENYNSGGNYLLTAGNYEVPPTGTFFTIPAPGINSSSIIVAVMSQPGLNFVSLLSYTKSVASQEINFIISGSAGADAIISYSIFNIAE